MNAPSPNTARPCSLLRLALAAAVGAFLFWFVQFNVEWQMEYRRSREERSVIDPVHDAWMVSRVLGLPKPDNVRIDKVIVPSLRSGGSAAVLFRDVDGVLPSVLARDGWRYAINDLGSTPNLGHENGMTVIARPTGWALDVLDTEDYHRRWMPIRRKFVDGRSDEWAMEEASVPLTLIQLPDDAQTNLWCLFFYRSLYSGDWYETRGAGTGEP